MTSKTPDIATGLHPPGRVTLLVRGRDGDGVCRRPAGKRFWLDADGARLGAVCVPKIFDVVERDVGSLAQLHTLLRAVELRVGVGATRWVRRQGAGRVGLRRLSRDDDATGDAATLQDHASRWLCVDIDNLSAPAGLDPLDLASVAPWAIQRALPETFHSAGVIAQHSSSAGLSSNPRAIKLHLWFWLSKPLLTTPVKRWLGEAAPLCARNAKTGAPVHGIDLSVYNPAHVLFIGAPCLGAGVVDPIQGPRSLHLPGPPVDVAQARRRMDLWAVEEKMRRDAAAQRLTRWHSYRTPRLNDKRGRALAALDREAAAMPLSDGRHIHTLQALGKLAAAGHLDAGGVSEAEAKAALERAWLATGAKPSEAARDPERAAAFVRMREGL